MDSGQQQRACSGWQKRNSKFETSSKHRKAFTWCLTLCYLGLTMLCGEPKQKRRTAGPGLGYRSGERIVTVFADL